LGERKTLRSPRVRMIGIKPLFLTEAFGAPRRE
jgi:hypothetical protein